MQDYLLDLGINDTLSECIRKCNRNFKTLLANRAKSDVSLTPEIERALDELASDLSDLVRTEQVAREQADSHLAPLNESGTIDPQYLPSYVDDIIEAYPLQSAVPLSEHWLLTQPSGSPIEPEHGKIYVLMEATQSYNVNSQFRWGGTEYVPISSGVVSDYQNAFSNVKVGSTTIAADTTTDTLELVAGSNVTLTPDATNDKVTIAATDTTYDTLNLSETNNKGLVKWSGTDDEGDYLLGATITNDGDVLFGNTLLVASDIPDLPASKIASGTFASARIPSLQISKIENLQTILTDLGNLKAPLASPALTGTPTAPTAASGTNTTQIATTAFVQAALGDVAGALVYRGTVSAASGMANFKKGWYWIASGSFTIGSGATAENVEAGDMLIANADGTSATAANIDVIQTNIETLTTTEIDTIWAAA